MFYRFLLFLHTFNASKSFPVFLSHFPCLSASPMLYYISLIGVEQVLPAPLASISVELVTWYLWLVLLPVINSTFFSFSISVFFSFFSTCSLHRCFFLFLLALHAGAALHFVHFTSIRWNGNCYENFLFLLLKLGRYRSFVMLSNPLKSPHTHTQFSVIIIHAHKIKWPHISTERKTKKMLGIFSFFSLSLSVLCFSLFSTFLILNKAVRVENGRVLRRNRQGKSFQIVHIDGNDCVAANASYFKLSGSHGLYAAPNKL